MATTAEVLAWLDKRGWPHDPRDWTKAQDQETRKALGICGHRNRRHEPCSRAPMANGRCALAGGKSRRGIVHPNYQGKGQGRYVMERWKDRYQRLRSDTELLNLTDQMAFLTLRIEDLMQRMDPAETGRTWKAMREEWAKLQRALKDPSPEGIAAVRETVMAISTLVSRGSSDAEAWDEVARLWEQQRRTSDTETKRRVLMKLFIRAEDVAADYDMVAHAVKAAVEKAVSRELISRKAANWVLMDVSEQFAKFAALPTDTEP